MFTTLLRPHYAGRIVKDAAASASMMKTDNRVSWSNHLMPEATEIKLRLDDPGSGALRVLEILEALSVGIEGKRLLWRALAAVAEDAPALRLTDYGCLEQRAQEQRQRVEMARLETAKTALGTTS